MQLARSAILEQNLSLSETEIPGIVEWDLRLGGRNVPVIVQHWDDSLRQMYRAGLLVARHDRGLKHNVIWLEDRGVYASTFAPGSALVAAPFFASLELWLHPLPEYPLAFWYAGKAVASLCAALSAVYVFLICGHFLNCRASLLIAVAYALGTAVWSTSSQALWQHGPADLFLAMGTFHLVRLGNSFTDAAACGLAYAASTWCRPTLAVVAASVAVYLLVKDRRLVAAYLLAALPLGLAMALYNWEYFGSILSFGQTQMADLAEFKTGSSQIWQTSLIDGLAGLLFSPSRGLFVFSPFLLFALAGNWSIWRDSSYAMLRPLMAAVAIIWIIEARHFDWWSGWSFGYRHICDTVPLFVLGLIPTLQWMARQKSAAVLFSVLFFWSLAVQFLGAFAFDFIGWNGRITYRIAPSGSPAFYTESRNQALSWGAKGAEVESICMDVDKPRYRYRLWSLTDNQIAYYATHLIESRTRRKIITRLLHFEVPVSLSDTHLAIAQAALEAGKLGSAREHLQLAWNYNPRNGTIARLFRQLCQTQDQAAQAERWAVAERGLKSQPVDVFRFIYPFSLDELRDFEHDLSPTSE